jgi:hypothetical protein
MQDDAYAYSNGCHPGATRRRWTQQRLLAAMRHWLGRHGQLPSSYDWSRTHGWRRGGEAQARLAGAEWPLVSVVNDLFGTWAAARAAARERGLAFDGRGAHDPLTANTELEASGSGAIGAPWWRAARI